MDKENEIDLNGNEKNKAFAIIMERTIFADNDELTIYSYSPVEVVKGTEVVLDNTKLFISKHIKSLKKIENDNKNEEIDAFEFPLINDISCLYDSFVYAFPLVIDSSNCNNLQNVQKEIINLIKDSKDLKIVHIVKKDDSYNKLFLNYNNTKVSIEGNDYYELFDLIYGDELEAVDAAFDKDEVMDDKNSIIVLPSDYLYSDDIYNKVSKTVICQDEQIKEVATVIAENSRLSSSDLKSTILLCGPTGVGKTEIFKSLSENFDVPITIEDSNEYTAASYKGKDVNEMLAHLLDSAGGDIEKAERGILVVDEIDKKISPSGEHDTYTSAVINSLLKMMEGHTYRISVGPNNEVDFNTSRLTFAFLGAFSGIEEYSKQKRTMGFKTKEDIEFENDTKNIYNDETIKKYGLLPEFVGRCDTIITMNNLTVDDFIKIITTSNKSQLLLYKYLLKELGIKFIYDDKTVEAIAKKASELGLGARSIKKIVKNALAVVNYEIFARNNYSELIISEDTIHDNKQYILR